MRFDFVVFGATGMQGKIITRDLLENGYSVLLCGRDKSRVEHLLKRYKKTSFEYFDAKDVNNMTEIIKRAGSTVAVCAVEGDWDLNVYKAAIKADASVIDLGSEIWMTKKQFELHGIMKKKKIIGITGCGSVPGVGSVMLNYASKKFDKIDTIEAGFAWDSNIKKFVVPFSIQSIIWEYTQHAPIIRGCRWTKVNPMDTVHDRSYREIDKQPCFHVVHPETYTFWKYFKNKGLKNVRFYAGFPKHSHDVIKMFIDTGIGGFKDINYQGKKITPVEFLTEVLKGIKTPEGYTEKENLWVKIQGKKNKKKKTILMECIVPTLKGWEDAGCNIDTGMPASIMAQMIKTGVIEEKGSFAPEACVPPEPFFRELRKRKMLVYENGKNIN